MFINRVHFRSVKSLNFDIPVGDVASDFSGRRRLLIQGGNGSGKTTLLESIADLWQFWGEWIDLGEEKAPPSPRPGTTWRAPGSRRLRCKRSLRSCPYSGSASADPWAGADCVRLTRIMPFRAGADRNRLQMIPKNVSGLDLKVLRNEALLGSSTGFQRMEVEGLLRDSDPGIASHPEHCLFPSR